MPDSLVSSTKVLSSSPMMIASAFVPVKIFVDCELTSIVARFTSSLPPLVNPTTNVAPPMFEPSPPKMIPWLVSTVRKPSVAAGPPDDVDIFVTLFTPDSPSCAKFKEAGFAVDPSL